MLVLAGINVMVINIQAFNATGKDNRRIYEELDDFQSRRPIDVISKNRPILFLDEPQKMEGGKTLESLAQFKPLMVIRYSATHKTNHLKDGWTILTLDNLPSAHFEHNVALIDGNPELLSTFKYIHEALGIISDEEVRFSSK